MQTSSGNQPILNIAIGSHTLRHPGREWRLERRQMIPENFN
jgi:hypothetical protein